MKGSLAVPALAWVFAVLWALPYVGVRSDWVWTAQAAVGMLVAAIAVAARWWEALAAGVRAELRGRTSSAAASSGRLG